MSAKYSDRHERIFGFQHALKCKKKKILVFLSTYILFNCKNNKRESFFSIFAAKQINCTIVLSLEVYKKTAK
jgi:hypothetical protein